MLLYHGRNVVVREPRIIASNRILDFGPGFYTTSNRQQAEQSSHKVSKRRGGKPIVNIYDFDEGYLKRCDPMTFDRPDGGWLDFVVLNRSNRYAGRYYDIVIGPVANDDIYGTIRAYEFGFATREATIQMLKVKNTFDQYVFKTDAAVSELRFVEAYYG